MITRAQWGFAGWTQTPPAVPLSDRRYVVVHYHGGPVREQYGPAVPRTVDTIHRANGWSGVGYHYMIDMAGEVYEGRGLDLVGSHCPGRNRDGFGVYLAVGGDQQPTPAALSALQHLYADLCQVTGRALTVGVHGDYYATDCAGPVLSPWVHAGNVQRLTPDGSGQQGPMPQPEEDDMFTDADRAQLAAVFNNAATSAQISNVAARIADLTGVLNEALPLIKGLHTYAATTVQAANLAERIDDLSDRVTDLIGEVRS